MSLRFQEGLKPGDILTKNRLVEKTDLAQEKSLNRRFIISGLELSAVLLSACVSPPVAIAVGFSAVIDHAVWIYKQYK